MDVFRVGLGRDQQNPLGGPAADQAVGQRQPVDETRTAEVEIQGPDRRSQFQAVLEQPSPPSIVAGVIRDVIESGTWKLRHPAGPTAEPFLAWRAGLTDEQWIDFNALDTESFRKRVKETFGLELKIAAEAAPGTAASAAG